MTRRVEGKIALVTGGASRPGLGFAIAERLAEEGAIVILTDIDAAGVAESAQLIAARNLAAEAMTHDVASADDWSRVVDEILARHGRLDIVVNNAGILDIAAVCDDHALAGLRQQIEVNVVGCFIGTQAGVRAMRQCGGGGAIVNLSSVAGKVGFRGSSTYAATKGAVKLMTKSVALETAAEGIRVNSVHPGIIRTNMQQKGLEDNAANYDAIVAGIPARRLGEPRDIANCVLFLASDEAAYVNGAEFVVDGGYTAQ
jgi:NAD(P)-dependent dehydrogenase (short-subunit alcohol dehydrogenase family)